MRFYSVKIYNIYLYIVYLNTILQNAQICLTYVFRFYMIYKHNFDGIKTIVIVFSDSLCFGELAPRP